VIRGVVTTSISCCDLCSACRVLCDSHNRHAVHTSQHEILVATTPHVI